MPTHLTETAFGVSLRRLIVSSAVLVAVGCTGVTHEPVQDAPAVVGTASAHTGPSAAQWPSPKAAAPASPSPKGDAPASIPSPADSTLQSVAELPDGIEPELASTPASVAEVVPERVEGGAAGAPTVAATEGVEPMSTPSPSLAASETSVQTLDFSSLAKRLRKTRAIGLVTKVAVKNESDDLLERFRAYHAQAGTATLADLRRSYDSLFLKLHALLEDADPPLAREIDRSRAAIWEYLADPRKFGSSQLMAGA